MEYTFAELDEKEKIKKLWNYSFDDEEGYVDYYFDNIYSNENNLLIKEDGIIISSLQLNPYKLVTHDYLTDVSYIVGVSTFPQFRGKGYASKLMRKTIRCLYEKQESISLLMAIDNRIYTRYGFETISKMDTISIDLNRIETLKSNYEIKVVEGKKQIQDLIDIYSHHSKEWIGYIHRDESYYERLISDTKFEKGEIFISYENNNPISYMVFYPKFDENKGYVKEIFSKNIFGIKTLLTIIKSHYTQINSVDIDKCPDINAMHIFSGDNKVLYKKRPFMMGRIINIQKVIENYNYKKICTEGYNEKVIIKIKDNIIEENNIYLSLDNEKIILDNFKKEYDIEMTIGDFTQIFFGFISFKEFLFKYDKTIHSEKIKMINNYFPKGISYFNEYV